ncbi:sulfate ABC transporter permease subunit CysW [soil metagenome]
MSATTVVLRAGVRRRIVRGLLLTLALVYVGVLLLAPTIGIVLSVLREGTEILSTTFARPDVQNALKLTVGITLMTVAVTALFGVITAWVLARDNFPGRSLLNAIVDLPMAVSPVIVGLMAVLLFGRGGWFEPFFAAQGIQIIFAVPSMVIVTIFISIPFVIREVTPVLQEIGTDEEEAAKTLGASSLQTFFRVTLPNIKWALLYGVALSAARAMGEIGAVLIVSGVLQGQNETATLFIFRALEERQDAQAHVVALTLASVSIVLLFAIEFFKHRQSKAISK